MKIGITWARGNGSTLEGKNKYPINGKPLIWYPLMSLMESQTVDTHYVFTEDDDIAATTLEVGWRVIPRPKKFLSYRTMGNSSQAAWKYITTYISKDLLIPLPDFSGDWITSFHLLSDIAFSLNCNNCMLRSDTFKKMLAMIQESKIPSVYPAAQVDDHLMLGHPDGYLFPLWHAQGLNRQFYPPLYRALLNTSFTNARAGVLGRPNYYYCEIEEIESMDVHSRDDIEFIEAYLECHPDYFSFSSVKIDKPARCQSA